MILHDNITYTTFYLIFIDALNKIKQLRTSENITVVKYLIFIKNFQDSSTSFISIF